MKRLILMWMESALQRLTSSRSNVRFARASAALVLPLLVSVGVPRAFAQEITSDDSTAPLVYSVENTGAQYSAPDFPSFGNLPIIRPLPDPFVFANGTSDTSLSSWERRRNEIKAAIEKYEIGPKPDCSDCTITATYTPPVAGTTNGVLTTVVTRKGKTLTLTSGVYIPQGLGSGPFPALIPMELGSMTWYGYTFPIAVPTPPDYASLPASVFKAQPIATVGFVLTQVAGYTLSGISAHTTDGFYTLYPELCAGVCTGASNSGEYAAWSWGVSRVIDGIAIATHQAVNPLPIDMSHLAVSGCSYAGKMALYAGAFDERVALTIAQENGGGGAASWRVSHEIEASGSVEDIDNTDYEWFGAQMQQFANDNVYKLPEDHDELMDMVAPRALLQTGNTDYYWLSNRSNYVSSRATQKVYNTFGIGDRFGFYIDGGHAHCGTLPAEAPVIATFVNKFLLGNATVNSDIEVHPFPTLDYARWTWWWGNGSAKNDPQFPTVWNDGSTLVAPFGPGLANVPINAGDTVQAGYQFMIPGAHPAATATLVSGNMQADVLCNDGSSQTITIPLPTNRSYSIPGSDNTWHPGTAVNQGSTTAVACGTGASQGTLQNLYFSALGISTGGGNPGGAGLKSTDTADPLDVRFSCSANGNSTGYSAAGDGNPHVQLSVTTALLRLADGSYQATVTVTNTGTKTAYNVVLAGGTLGSAKSSPISVPLNGIAPNSSAVAILTFPSSAGASAAKVVEKLAGTYTGGTFGGSYRATLP